MCAMKKRTATGQKWPFVQYRIFRRKREEDLSNLTLHLFYSSSIVYDEIPSLNKACYVYTARGGLSR